MRKKYEKILVCPNNINEGLIFYGIDVMRSNEVIHHIASDAMLDDDDVINGLLISKSSNTVYPISNYIAILLADADVDNNHHLPLLQNMVEFCPDQYKNVLSDTISRLIRSQETSDGKWNREEMRYYDKEVDSAQLRDEMVSAIKIKPIWRIFLPRKKYITDKIKEACKDQLLLEIGSGNSRTIANIFRPLQYQYHYIGSDISFKRLMVAKAAVPEGDFIQASALALPFAPKSFKAVISFGMLHHLPRPADAVSGCIKLIQKNGFFCFHEPFIKPAVSFPGIASFKKLVTTYQHSDHDQKINLNEILTVLNKSGFTVYALKKHISFFRSFTESILKKISLSLVMKKSVINLITASDEIVLHTIGKVSKRFGAGTVCVVMKKNVD